MCSKSVWYGVGVCDITYVTTRPIRLAHRNLQQTGMKQRQCGTHGDHIWSHQYPHVQAPSVRNGKAYLTIASQHGVKLST
jgi:hypothetical protein